MLVKVLRVVFVVAVLVAVGLVVADHVDELRDVEIRWSPAWLLLAVPAQVGATGLLPVGWRQLVLAFGPAPDLGPATARRVWWLSQVARYLPSGVVGFATRVVMARQQGVAVTVTGATLALELLHLVALPAVIGAITAVTLPVSVRAAIAVGGAVALVLADTAAPAGSRLLDRLVSAEVPRPARRPLVRASGTFGLSVLLRAIRGPAVAAAVTPVTWAAVPAIVAADNLGAAAGTLGVTPAGLGTREAVTVALLQPRLGLGGAVTIAVALRVFDLAVELAWVGWAAATRVVTAAPADTEPAADPEASGGRP